MALKQTDRFLRIDTVLTNPDSEDADDNFVLIQVRGAEGLSFPYAFDLSLIGPQDKHPDPAEMIGSRARFGIKHLTNPSNEDDFDFVMRHGIIESFARTGPMGDFASYSARLVPAFKLTGYETRFRVFEDQTLEQILRTVLRPYPEIVLNTNPIAEEAAERIPYCVQFGESTFNFVHRLLDRFGIAYRFDHELDQQHEVMVLHGRGSVPRSGSEVVNLGTGEPDFGKVTGFTRTFAMATRAANVGNFNEINPATPFRGRSEIAPAYDLMGEHTAFEGEAFPVPATVSPQPRNYADRRMRQNESTIFGITGQSKNMRFRAGGKFIVVNDATVPESGKEHSAAGKTFLIKTCSIFAYDHSALLSTGSKLFNMIKNLIGLGSDDGSDVANAAAKALLDQVKTDVEKGKAVFDWLGKEPGASNPSGLPDFVGKALGLGGSALAGAIPLVISTFTATKDLIDKLFKGDESIAIAFDALPLDAPFLRDVMPTPAAAKPIAHGPHLAMVIGPDGIDTARREIFTDALGRVRIRFPWDPGPDNPNDPIGQDPLMTGRNTCFVRVSDGWAGERFGTQFTPRIGQEVVIGFVDGDPERPMVVGRTYNARGGSSQVPFLPQASLAKQLSLPDDLKGTETDQATRSGIRSRTTPRKPQGQSGFHMLRLEDKEGEEQFLIRSERRMDQTAFGSRFDTTRGNLNILVGGPHEEGKPPPGGAMATTTGGTYDLHVGDKRYENIDANWEVTAKGDVTYDITGGMTDFVKGDAKLAAASITLQARNKITLHVGASSIVITPASIYIQAAMVRENQGAPADSVADATVTEALDAGQADPGEPPDFLARQPKGGGGGRRTHKATAQRALGVFRGPDNKIHIGNPKGPPGAVTIDDSDPDFADRVAQDLNNLAQDPATGPTLNAVNERTDKPVVIKKGAPTPNGTGVIGFSAADKSNATQAGEPTGRFTPDGQLERGTGEGSGGTAFYDPKDWPRPGETNSPSSQKMLGQLMNLANTSQNGQVPGNTYSGAVPPSPPPPRSPPSGTP